MRILFLTQILPYPPDSGPRVKTWNVLNYLSERGHDIILVSFVRTEELPYIDKVHKICSQVHPVPIKRSRIGDIGYLLRSQFSGRPFLIERDDLKTMRSLVKEILSGGEIDVIHCDQLTMAQFAMPSVKQNGNQPALFFDAHNAVWTIVERMRETAPFYMKIPLSLEAKRVKKYEANIVSTFDHTFAVSEPDRKALTEAVLETGGKRIVKEPPISVIPIAVNTDVLIPEERNRDSMNILTLGTLYYPPNADGIRWFIQEVFPLVRQELKGATLTIVGKNPPHDLVELSRASQDVIKVTGYVPDLDPYFAQSPIIVIPVRAGGGMRVRILEAFARGMPVVTTTVGLEGINALPGEDVLIGDDPVSFSREVIRLLQDKELQSQLASNGRRLAETKYAWRVVLKDLEKIYLAYETQKTSSYS